MYSFNCIIVLCFIAIFVKESTTKKRLAKKFEKKVFYDTTQSKKMFSSFIRDFKKKFTNDEEYNYRLEMFKKNLVLANKINRKSRSAVFGINKLMDMSANETRNCSCLRIGKNITKTPCKLQKRSRSGNRTKLRGKVPDKWDWRYHNADNKPSYQYECSSCWAITSASVVESRHAIKHKKLLRLSVQQFLDCSGWRNNCYGGDPQEAITAQATLVGGVVLAKKYPYVDRKRKCWVNRKDVVVKVIKGNVLDIHDEEALKRHIFRHGPVVAGIITGMGFHMYREGIAYKEDLGCATFPDINHAVVIVGYGKDRRGEPFWVIKNNDGTGWGDQGYMYLHRGSNACSIMKYLADAEVA